MSATTLTVPGLAAPRPRLISLPLVLMCIADFGALMSFYLLLPVVPQYAATAGTGGISAGLTTGALMLSTVGAELVTPRLVSKYGHAAVLAAGLVLLGLPALALLASSSMTVIVPVCLVRGAGLAIVFVVCGALGAELVPAERRGEGLGVLGLVAGLPAVIAMPLGVWLVDNVGFSLVFIVGAVSALTGLAALPGLAGRPGKVPQGQSMAVDDEPLGILAGFRTSTLLRPSIVFAATAMTGGIVATFLPTAVASSSAGLAALGLLAHSAVGTAARLWAGRYGDRHGAARLLVPGALAAAAGMLALVLIANPGAMIVGMLLAGGGFGVVQNASMAMMFDRVSASGYGTVSALWSVAYDAGFGLGAAGFGIVVAGTGYPAGFAVTAAMVLAIVLIAREPAGR